MLKKTTFLAMFAWLLCAGICGVCIAADNEPGFFELRARVTSIDFAHNRIVVAEKEMVLPSHFEKNKTVWDTRFMDMAGGQISPDRIKSRSRVLVRGGIDNGKPVAREIILLE